jgi:hypothetical protein
MIKQFLRMPYGGIKQWQRRKKQQRKKARRENSITVALHHGHQLVMRNMEGSHCCRGTFHFLCAAVLSIDTTILSCFHRLFNYNIARYGLF